MTASAPEDVQGEFGCKSSIRPCLMKIVDRWKGKIAMGRMALPHELKGTYLYLCSDASSYTIGVDIVVDGGYILT